MDKMDYIETLIKNITYICREKNITPHMLGKESGVGKDIITNMNKGSLPSCDKLAKIADYCDVSVDYLLGRTDEPKTETSDPTTQILVERFSSLSPEDKIDVLNMVLEKSKK